MSPALEWRDLRSMKTHKPSDSPPTTSDTLSQIRSGLQEKGIMSDTSSGDAAPESPVGEHPVWGTSERMNLMTEIIKEDYGAAPDDDPEASVSPVFGKADHDFKIEYIVKQRTNAAPQNLKNVVERFRREIELQFGSTVDVSIIAITDTKAGLEWTYTFPGSGELIQ